MRLDVDAARRAVEEKVAGPMGLSLTDAAWGIHRVVNENMAGAARVHGIERGKDLRAYPLFAFGGAGPVHAWQVGRILKVPRVLVPFGAGAMSAYGLLAAPLAFDFVRTAPQRLDAADWQQVNRLFGEMEAEGRRILRGAERAGRGRAHPPHGGDALHGTGPRGRGRGAPGRARRREPRRHHGQLRVGLPRALQPRSPWASPSRRSTGASWSRAPCPTSPSPAPSPARRRRARRSPRRRPRARRTSPRRAATSTRPSTTATRSTPGRRLHRPRHHRGARVHHRGRSRRARQRRRAAHADPRAWGGRVMDPITLDICWNRLIGVVNEQAAALMRTSFTSIVREAGDLSAGRLRPARLDGRAGRHRHAGAHQLHGARHEAHPRRLSRRGASSPATWSSPTTPGRPRGTSTTSPSRARSSAAATSSPSSPRPATRPTSAATCSRPRRARSTRKGSSSRS